MMRNKEWEEMVRSEAGGKLCRRRRGIGEGVREPGGTEHTRVPERRLQQRDERGEESSDGQKR